MATATNVIIEFDDGSVIEMSVRGSLHMTTSTDTMLIDPTGNTIPDWDISRVELSFYTQYKDLQSRRLV